MGLLSKLIGKFSGPPSKDKFARMFLNGIKQAGESRNIAYDSTQFRLAVTGDNNRVMFLDNLYAEYCSVPESERNAVLQRSVRSWFAAEKTIPDSLEDASHDLLPAVRTRGYLASAALLMMADSKEVPDLPPHQVIGEDLVTTLVYDLPETMVTVNQDVLDKWGITFYEALEIARDNLAKLPCQFVGPKDGDGIYLSATSDNYDASRLLLLDAIRQMKVKGETVAMVSSRDVLIVGGSEDADGLKAMLALAKDALQKPRPMSGIAMRLDGEEWVPWLPDPSHPLYGEFHLLAIQSRGSDYNEQKELLEQLHKKTGEDIFVASFSAMQDQDTKQVTTYTIWPQNVPTLLPHTDKIAFMRTPQEKALMADWDRAVEIVGDLMEPQNIYPERVRVSEFPTERQLADMEAKAL